MANKSLLEQLQENSKPEMFRVEPVKPTKESTDASAPSDYDQER